MHELNHFFNINEAFYSYRKKGPCFTFNFLDIVAENGGRGPVEVAACKYGQHTQESLDGPGTVWLPFLLMVG